MRRLFSAILAASALTSCVAWRPQPGVTPQQLLAKKPEDVIKVATHDSTKGFLVYQPKIVGDTLMGHPSETAIFRMAIPVKDITEVSTRYRHVGKTLLASLAIIGGVAIYGLLQSLNSTP